MSSLILVASMFGRPAEVVRPSAAQLMPVGDLPGWHQRYANDFSATVPLGSFPGADHKMAMGYKNWTLDSAGKQGRASMYFPSKVLSESGGVLDYNMHYDASLRKWLGAAPDPKINGSFPYNSQLYGRYSTRLRADSQTGLKLVFLLWPDSFNWPCDGEIDVAEGNLSSNATGATHFDINGCAHSGGNKWDKVIYGVKFNSWHVYTVEWRPGSVKFYVDGALRLTSAHSPTTPMHMVMQAESCFSGCPASTKVHAHVQVDWVTIYSRI